MGREEDNLPSVGIKNYKCQMSKRATSTSVVPTPTASHPRENGDPEGPK